MWKTLSKRLCKAAGIVALLVLCGVAIGPLLRFMRRHSPDPLSRLLEHADEKAWLNNWIDAAPLYRRAARAIVAGEGGRAASAVERLATAQEQRMLDANEEAST